MFLRFRFVLLAIVLPCFFVSCNKDEEKEDPYDVLVDFQKVDIPNGTYKNDAGEAGFFEEGIVRFQNAPTSWGTWYGFAYSQMHDTETPGYENEYSVYVFNDPPENKFMVGFVSFFDTPSIEITFTEPVKDLSFDIANSTYAALTMKDGDAFTQKFTESDWFELTIKVTATDGIETITIKLGEGTKITNVWNPIKVESNNITKLEFSLDSSDADPDWGMNTPAYFCIDNIKARTVK